MKVLTVFGEGNEKILEIAVNVVGDDFTFLPAFPMLLHIAAITLTEIRKEVSNGNKGSLMTKGSCETPDFGLL